MRAPVMTGDTGLMLDGHGAVYRQLERALRAQIASGRWHPGYRLPSEHDLMRALGVSRMTVNRALSAIADDGLVVRRRRAGTTVAPQTMIHAAVAIADIRSDIAGTGKSYKFRLVRRATRRASAGDCEHLEVPAGTPLLALRGVHLADGDPEIVEERLINTALVPEALDASFTEEPPGTWLLKKVPWSRATFAISAARADKPIIRALGVDKSAAVLIQERRTWRGSLPVTWVRLTFRSDRHQFSGSFTP
jgi:GntR family transcriptional regulator, histidine utilization repressor